jgi:hypothetical protein
MLEIGGSRLSSGKRALSFAIDVPFEGPQTNPGNNQVPNTTASTLPHPLFSTEANTTPSELSNISPTLLDPETQQKGLEAQKVLQLFKQSTS